MRRGKEGEGVGGRVRGEREGIRGREGKAGRGGEKGVKEEGKGQRGRGEGKV